MNETNRETPKQKNTADRLRDEGIFGTMSKKATTQEVTQTKDKKPN